MRPPDMLPRELQLLELLSAMLSGTSQTAYVPLVPVPLLSVVLGLALVPELVLVPESVLARGSQLQEFLLLQLELLQLILAEVLVQAEIPGAVLQL